MIRIGRFVVFVLATAAWCTGLGPVQAQEKDKAAQIKKLLKERAEVLNDAVGAITAQYERGLVTELEIGRVVREAHLADLQASSTAEERIAALGRFRQATEKVLEKVAARKAVGVAKQFDVDMSRAAFLTAGIELLREELMLKADPAKTAELNKLLKQRSEVLDEAIAIMLAQYEAGVLDLSEVFRANRDALNAKLELHSKVEERVIVLQKFQGISEQMAEKVNARKMAGVAKQVDLDEARAALMQVRIELLREELKLKADPARTADVNKLLKQRSEVLDEAIAIMLAQYEAGVLDLSEVFRANRDALNAKLELHSKVEERVVILKAFLKTATDLRDSIEKMHKAGGATHFQASQARAQVLALRIELLREEAKLAPPKNK